MNKSLSILLIFLLNSFQIQPSIVTASDQLLPNDAATAVFIDQNKFYVGQSAIDATNPDKSISSLELSIDTGVLVAKFAGKAPARGVTVNGAASSESTMYNQMITKLASTATEDNNSQKYLVAALNTDQVATTKNSVTKILLAGKSELSNTNEINDATGAHVNKPYISLASSIDTIFVAVPPTGADFGAENSGVVRLKATQNPSDGLKVQKLGVAAQAGDDENAYKIDLTALYPPDAVTKLSYAHAMFAVTQKAPTESEPSPVLYSLGPTADLWWDQKLKCLYLGLVKATTIETSNKSGACTLLVGQINNSGQLVFKTSVPLAVVNSLNDSNRMVCYAAGNPSTNVVSTFKVRIMHTSTGKDYAITVGDAITVDIQIPEQYLTTQVNVYALPLVNNGATNTSLNGMIAKKDSSTPGGIDFTKNVDSATTMLGKDTDKAQVTVGVNSAYLADASQAQALKDAAITDIQIVGDTVYISLAGNRSTLGQASEAGIFESSAIFNEYGVIRAWTPWQRVMGVAEKVYNFGLDKNTNSFWYIGPDKKTGKVTVWSTGDGTNVHPNNATLSAALTAQNAFEDDFGIINMINFDDETLGFKLWDITSSYPYFSMMVATGFNQVAIIQTGMQGGNFVFQPTVAFASSGDSQNVFIFDKSELSIGAINCAEVARSTAENKGWLFVGGSGGIAVLSQNNGFGWNGSEGLFALSAKGFPGPDYTFKIINLGTGNSFTDVRKLICDGTYLYVLTAKNLYRLKMDAKYFRGRSTVTFDSTDFTTLAAVQSTGEFFDMVQIQLDYTSAPRSTPPDSLRVNSKFVLATDRGLAVLDSSKIGNLDYTYIKYITTGTTVAPFTSGPAVKLDFVSAKKGGKFDNATINTVSEGPAFANGNLYVTAFDAQMKGLYCYRFNVQVNSNSNANSGVINITLFSEPYVESGTTPNYFYKVVDLSKMEKPIYINRNADLNMQSNQFSGSIAISPDPDKFLTTAPIDLGYPANRIPSFGSVIHDTASGALYAPGDFGLVVCE